MESIKESFWTRHALVNNWCVWASRYPWLDANYFCHYDSMLAFALILVHSLQPWHANYILEIRVSSRLIKTRVIEELWKNTNALSMLVPRKDQWTIYTSKFGRVRTLSTQRKPHFTGNQTPSIQSKCFCSLVQNITFTSVSCNGMYVLSWEKPHSTGTQTLSVHNNTKVQ